MPAVRLILASASPRRQQLLRDAGYAFVVHPADVDESDHPAGISPGELADFLARRKAQVVSGPFPGDVVLAADTVVAYGQSILGKPSDAEDAARMLRLLSGTIHSVITAVAVVRTSPQFASHAQVVSTVHMRALSDQEIASYVASGMWVGKAGGYGIQDPDPFVTRTAGCQSNIVGLPMRTTARLLAEAGVKVGKPEARSQKPEI